MQYCLLQSSYLLLPAKIDNTKQQLREISSFFLKPIHEDGIGYSQFKYSRTFYITVTIQHPFPLTSYFYPHFHSDLSLLHIFLGATLKK